MIDLSLNRYDFVAAVEGFARGSHLRQHVWHSIVYLNMPQMSDDEIDFFWFIFRRNLWDCYFREDNGHITKQCGYRDYLHVLAALHRGNRHKVTFYPDSIKHPITCECYRFGGHYCPLFTPGQDNRLASFGFFIPNEWIEDAVTKPFPLNNYVEESKIDWWTDLSIYDDERLL